jgi:hypothetical protein
LLRFQRLLPALAVVLAPTVAAAEVSSATCRRLRAEAASTAVLLYAPEVELQALRVPPGGELEQPDTSAWRDLQARAALSFSPVDVARGRSIEAAAEADCERVIAAEHIDRVLRHRLSFGRADALDAQLAFFDARLGGVDALVEDAERRLERGLTTAADVEMLRLRRLALYRKRSAARQERAVLAAEGADAPLPPLAAELASYERAVGEMERQRSRVRRLAGWDLRVRGGAAAAEDGPAWFGMVSLSYDLGHPWQADAERRYLAARADELAGDEMELRAQVDRFHRGLRDSAGELRDELALVELEVAAVEQRLDDLRRIESASARERIAAAELERLDLEADRTYLRRLLGARDAALAQDRGEEHDR